LFKNYIKNKKKPSMDVIDCCSAPGNKTLQLSEYIKNGYYVKLG